MISVIMTSYNYEEYIFSAIESILTQTFKDWELIIVDDFSTDNSVSIITQFKNEKIKFIQHNKNRGLKASILTGLKYARGSWICFLESDDLWLPETLEKRVSAINDNVGIIFNDVELFGDKNLVEKYSKKLDKNRKILNSFDFPKYMFKDISVNNLIPTFSSVMIKKTVLDKVSFDTPIDSLSDWWLYIQILYDNQVFYIDEKLTKWRLHNKSYKQKPHKPYLCFANVSAYLKVYRDNKDTKLLFFAIKTFFKMCLIRLKIYFKKYSK